MKVTKVDQASLVIAEKELTCDVLVVGMGFAGLVAALRALELGARVIAIDKQPEDWWTPGGNMIISGGKIHLSHRSLAIPETELTDAITTATEGMIPQDLLRVTVQNAGTALKWLIEKGAEFVGPPGRETILKPGFPHQSIVWGRLKPGGMHDAAGFGNKRLALRLEALIKEKGGNILYESKAIKLLTNSIGEVVGALVQDKDGRFDIKAKGVIMCTGGYERNNEMLLKYVGPGTDEVIRYCGPGCTGDGFQMCYEYGAYLRSMNYAAFAHLYSTDAYWKEDLLGANLGGVASAGIIVNSDGERFVDEALGARIVGSVMTKTTIHKKAWIIVDNIIHSTSLKVRREIDNVREFGGTIYTADSIDELGRRAGIGPRLMLTIAEFNKAADEDKSVVLKVPKTKNINKISTHPFYAIPCAPGLLATYGGFLVSPKAEILNWDKKPIPNLYAAGECMEGSLSGGAENARGAYVGCLAACLIFGLIAAENAVNNS